MAMPHIVFKRKCNNELKGLSGEKRIQKIDEILANMPQYKDGPFAGIRHWLNEQKTKAKISKSTFSHENWEVKKYGDFTFALVGLPSVGKSTLVKELTNAQIEVNSYDFTTVKPFSAIAKIQNAQIQIIDLPGIILGASKGKGFGRRVLGNAKIADKILLVVDSIKTNQLQILIKELKESNIGISNASVIFTKSDLAKTTTNQFDYINTSVKEKKSFKKLKSWLFYQTNLIRVKPYDSEKPVILQKGNSVKDYCEKIHSSTVEKFLFAKVSGSTKFPKQRVGLEYVLKDLDEIELVLKH